MASTISLAMHYEHQLHESFPLFFNEIPLVCQDVKLHVVWAAPANQAVGELDINLKRVDAGRDMIFTSDSECWSLMLLVREGTDILPLFSAKQSRDMVRKIFMDHYEGVDPETYHD